MFPKFLYSLDISIYAKFVFIALYNRGMLSKSNGWNKDGNIFLNYSIESIANDLNISLSSTKRALNELEKIDLIQRKRRGKGIANDIYLRLPSDSSDSSINEKVIALIEPSDGSVRTTRRVCENYQVGSERTTSKKEESKNDLIRKNERDQRDVGSTSRYTRNNNQILGKYSNVRLSDIELLELQKDFPSSYLTYIEKISEYMEYKGKNYNNHFITIKKWIAEDKTKTTQTSGARNYDYDGGNSL